MQLKILRGCSGSGKSTHVRTLTEKAQIESLSVEVVSADNFFCDSKGVYHFDPTKLSEAHGECFRKCINALRDKVDIVIVDNTNTTAVEIAPYMAAAQAYGYEAEIILVSAKIEDCIARNIHGVPAGVVRNQAKNIEKAFLPPWWKQIQT